MNQCLWVCVRFLDIVIGDYLGCNWVGGHGKCGVSLRPWVLIYNLMVNKESWSHVNICW